MAILPRKISFLTLKRNKKINGFTLIEVMIVVAIILILLLIGIWAYRLQLLKGRDARRKANLAEWQRMLEDYINDSVCYPEGVVCGSTTGKSFEGYLSEIPCDPLDNTNYNYMYTYVVGPGCNKWYKIYTKLENENDPIIGQMDCEGGCGPSDNYNYWIGSPNVTEVAQLPGEFWPDIPGVPEPSPSEPSQPGPSPSELPTPSPSALPGPSPSAGGPLPPITDPQNCFNDGDPICLFNCTSDEPTYPNCCGSCCGPGGYRCDKEINKCILDPVCSQ